MVGKKNRSKQHRLSLPPSFCPCSSAVLSGDLQQGWHSCRQHGQALKGHHPWCVIPEFRKSHQSDAGQLQADTLSPGPGDLELASQSKCV